MTGIVEDTEFGNEGESRKAESESMERSDSIEQLAFSEHDDEVRLDDATLEPAAQVETSGDYDQAEAIEMAMHELIDADQESATLGGKGAFGQDTGDPSQHYSGVQMTQGEVHTDQDWNESANTPPTEEKEGGSTSANQLETVNDRSVEERVDGSEFLGYVSSVKGGTAKAELAIHELGEEKIERKGITTVNLESPPGGPVLDVEPIPPSEIEVEEGVIPKRDGDDERADLSQATESDPEKSKEDE